MPKVTPAEGAGRGFLSFKTRLFTPTFCYLFDWRVGRLGRGGKWWGTEGIRVMVRIKDNEARTEVVGLRTDRKRRGSKPFRK